MSDEELEPARIEKESLIECTKCGWETSASWIVDFEEDTEFYKKLLRDHKFMCNSDFPDFEVTERRQEALVRVSDLPQKWECGYCDCVFYCDADDTLLYCPKCEGKKAKRVSAEETGEEAEE